MRLRLWVLVVASVGVGTAGAVYLNKAGDHQIRHGFEISAVALTAAYRNDPNHARNHYDGARLVVSGVVVGINGGLFGDGAIYLAGGPGTEVHCGMRSIPDSLRAGQHVRIAGTCGVMELGVVQLDGCEVLNP